MTKEMGIFFYRSALEYAMSMRCDKKDIKRMHELFDMAFVQNGLQAITMGLLKVCSMVELETVIL
jgi:hypothetical protein